MNEKLLVMILVTLILVCIINRINNMLLTRRIINLKKKLDTEELSNKVLLMTMEQDNKEEKDNLKVNHINGIGQLHGTCGEMGIVPEVDNHEIIEKEKKYMTKCGTILYDSDGKVKKVYKDFCHWGVGNNGFIFYDEEAFKTSLDKVCYVPEYGEDEESYYTHQKFLDLVDGVEELAAMLFGMVDWQSPETLLAELEDCNIFYYCENCGKICREPEPDEEDANECCPHCGKKIEDQDEI